MGAQRAAEIEETVGASLEQAGDEAPALLIGVWDPAQGVYASAHGKADLKSGEEAELDDGFRIGSVTKTFVATLVLQQVADGSLDLDSPVGEHLPELAETHPEIGEVTIRQLLAMRSGLPDFEEAVTGRAASDATVTTKTWTAEEIIDTAMESGEVERAGRKTADYSNTNYIVLGELLEEITGRDLPELIATELLEPYGLSRTTYPPADDTSLEKPFLRGYVTATGVAPLTTGGGTLEPNTDVTDWTASWGGAAGIMSSNIDDLATWAAADFGSAQLPESLQPERLEFAPLKQLRGLADYGLGLLKTGSWVGHTGEIPGWNTLAMRNEDSGAIVVMAVNSSGDVASLMELTLLEALYPGTTGLAG